MEHVRYYWELIRSSLWFVPLVMCLSGIVLAIALLTNRADIAGKSEYWLLYTGDAENARELMSTLLSGMITMTSLVVSITMVVLTLAAGQIGPRLIRSFIQDRTTQLVLGLFLADILYLLVVFRTIDAQGDSVPHLAVSTGTGITALCLLILLYFVHRLARSIIYDNVIQNVGAELRRTVRHIMPADPAQEDKEYELGGDAAPVALTRHGYIQSIDYDRLVKLAQEAGAVIAVDARPGQFVLNGDAHVRVQPAAAAGQDLRDCICKAFVIGAERTPNQDVEYAIRQLVEICTRALSPGLNDIFTALAVIDNLTASLAEILSRGQPPTRLCDDQGAVRVVRSVVRHDTLIAAAFDQVRRSGGTMAGVLIHLMEAVIRLAAQARTAAQRAALLTQLEEIQAAGRRNLSPGRDLDMLEQRSLEARARLTGADGRS